MKIFHIIEKRFPRANVFTADLPQVAVENIKEHHLAYAVSEIQRLIEFLTEITGHKINYDRLAEAVALSDQACALWDELMAYRKYIPTPFSAAGTGSVLPPYASGGAGCPATTSGAGWMAKGKNSTIS